MSADAPSEREKIAAAVEKVGIGHLRRHVFLCAGPKCCDAALGDAVWAQLKKRVPELGLNAGAQRTARTRCHCLHVCAGGPIALVYPEGVWYGNLTPENLERVMQEHLLDGRVVEELVIARGALEGDDVCEECE